MASNLIFQIVSKYDNAGTKQVSDALDDVKNKMQNTANASRSIGDSLSSVVTILKSAAFALPLANFVSEATRSEAAFANLAFQAKIFGTALNQIDFDNAANKARTFAGITGDELARAMATSLRFFKDTRNELALMDTALGIAQATGVSLSTAFTELGRIQQGYGDRIVRILGVNIDKSIRDPIERGADSIRKITALYAPLAAGTDTAAKSFKVFGANIQEAGEKFAGPFVASLKAITDAFNKLTPSTQEFIVNTVLLATTLGGLTQAVRLLGQVVVAANLTKLGSDLALIANADITKLSTLSFTLGNIGAALKTLAVPAGIAVAIAGLAGVITAVNETNRLNEQTNKIRQDSITLSKQAASASLENLGTEISRTEDLDAVLKELTKTRDLLIQKQIDAASAGNGTAALEAQQEQRLAQLRIDNVQKLAEARKSSGLATEKALEDAFIKATNEEHDAAIILIQQRYAEEINNAATASDTRRKLQAIEQKELDKALQDRKAAETSFQKDLGALRLAAVQDSINQEATRRKALGGDLFAIQAAQSKALADAEIAQRRIQLQNEIASANDAFRNSLAFRTALVQKEVADENAIRTKALQDELSKTTEFALLSSADQKKFLDDERRARDILASTTLENLKNESDANKEILRTQAGQVVFQNFVNQKIQERVLQEQQLAAAAQAAEVDSLQKRLIFEKEALSALTLRKIQEDASGKITDEQAKATQKEIDYQKLIIAQLQEKIGLKKEQNALDTSTIGNAVNELGINQQQIARVEATTNINVTVTPNVGELANSVSQKVKNEVELRFKDIQTEFERQLQGKGV